MTEPPMQDPWIERADLDLDAVRRALIPDPRPNLEVAAYHCQQAAEKLIKAVLVFDNLAYPRGSGGHDLLLLAERLGRDHTLFADAEALSGLTPWATAYRYPFDDPAAAPPTPGWDEVSIARDRIVGFRSRVIAWMRGSA